MAYQPITNFGVKDTLGPDNPDKIIYGVDFQVEFDSISENLIAVDKNLTNLGEFVEEAPSDNVVYGRKNDKWVSVNVEAGGVSEAPTDGKQYARKDADWSEVAASGGGIAEAPVNGKQYARKDADWTEIAGSSGGIPEAPTDGKQYARESAGWTEVVGAPTAWGDVTGKPLEFPPSSHGHAWDEITGKPSEFTPSSHDHSIEEVTGLQAALTDIDATSVKSGTFTETVIAPRYQGGSATLELNLANNFTMDFSGAAAYALGLSGAASAAGDAYGFTLTLDTTGMSALTWDTKIKWSTGTAPTLTAGVTYVFTFLTTDNGATFKAFVGGEGFA